MTALLSVLGVIIFALFVLLGATRPPRARVSLFELRRRQAARDKKASEALRREELLAQAGTLKAPLGAVLLVALTVLLIYLLGWERGIVAALLAGVLQSRLARLKAVEKLADRLYKRYEARLLRAVARHEGKIRLIGGRAPLEEQAIPIGSYEELGRVLDASRIFSDDDKQLVKKALRFKKRTVGGSMVPRDKLATVKYTELLGPLVLDDLHKTGHSVFPVTKGKDIVGLLDISDHAALRTKESVHVKNVMQTDIAKVNQGDTLSAALEIFVGTRQPLLIVVDDGGQAVGLISLGDIVRELIG